MALATGLLAPGLARANPEAPPPPSVGKLESAPGDTPEARLDALLDQVERRSAGRRAREARERAQAQKLSIPLGQLPKPKEHTPLFRRRHAREAQRPDARCFDCHQGVERGIRDTCQSCHILSVPKNHNLRFRTVGHGRVSARDPSACATCHEVDFCTECHNIPPSNHQPIALFFGNHARAARGNPRSCMTCHSFEATCERCHSIDASIPVVNVPNAGAGQ
ncbi:MAG: hypothetical protein AAFU79_11175 [Myxococcota bacterium]